MDTQHGGRILGFEEPVPQLRVGPPPTDPAAAGETPSFELDLEEARDSEELHALYRDLEYVIETVNQLSAHLRQYRDRLGNTASVGGADIIARALWEAALVAYIRCFTSGVRQHKLDEGIFVGEAEYLREWHDLYKDTRDKHVAHSVSPFEQHHATVWIKDQQGANPEVRGVGTVYLTRAGASAENVAWLGRLATYAQVVVFGRMEEANRRLEDRVEQFTDDELRSLKQLDVRTPYDAEAGTPRTRAGRQKKGKQ